ncbi:MAG TPA: PRC-barrel domain-containing protein [Urbifossiella sp.]|jgi:hypothetical protein|nr:PRC-barrel domain-containing protein [Urbifossiella sp.]
MTRNLLCTLAVTLAAAGFASAQQPVPIPPPGAPPVGGDPTAYRAKDILGSRVLVQNAGVGTVEDIVFSSAGDVEYLVVAAADGKLTSVPWAAAVYNPAQRTAVINIAPDRWRAIPTFTVQTYPQFFTPTYRTEVYRTYGLTPGELRRVDRRIERRIP